MHTVPIPRYLIGLFLLGGCSGNGGVEPPPTANNIAAHEGNNQSAAPGASVATAPSVIVTDAEANPVSGVAVTFAVTSGGGSLAAANQTTNSSGIATVGSYRSHPERSEGSARLTCGRDLCTDVRRSDSSRSLS